MGKASKAMACAGTSDVTAETARRSKSAPAVALAVSERNCRRASVVFIPVDSPGRGIDQFIFKATGIQVVRALLRPDDEHDAEADVRIVPDTEEAALANFLAPHCRAIHERFRTPDKGALLCQFQHLLD
jgi:hypothetical protein